MGKSIVSLNVRRGSLPVESVTDFTVDGKCSGCGNCCSNRLGMTEKEIATIRKYIKKHHIKPSAMNLPFADDVIDLTCPFLDKTKKTERCMIYPVRPYICRNFNCGQGFSFSLHDKEIKEGFLRINVRNTFFPSK